jgi:hypothetical protein
MLRFKRGDLVVGPRPMTRRLDLDALNRRDGVVFPPTIQDGNTHKQGEQLPQLVRGGGRRLLGREQGLNVFGLHLLDEAMPMISD